MTDATLAVDIVDWQALSATERDAVRGRRISAARVELADTVDRSIAACEAGDRSAVVGLAIRVEAEVAGWVVLKRGPAAPDWVAAGAAVVSGLRIDARHQGRGIGSAALGGMASRVTRHWPETSMLMLRVDDDDVAGVRAYEQAGWIESGERRMGRFGLERTMSLAL